MNGVAPGDVEADWPVGTFDLLFFPLALVWGKKVGHTQKRVSKDRDSARNRGKKGVFHGEGGDGGDRQWYSGDGGGKGRTSWRIRLAALEPQQGQSLKK